MKNSSYGARRRCEGTYRRYLFPAKTQILSLDDTIPNIANFSCRDSHPYNKSQVMRNYAIIADCLPD